MGYHFILTYNTTGGDVNNIIVVVYPGKFKNK